MGVGILENTFGGVAVVGEEEAVGIADAETETLLSRPNVRLLLDNLTDQFQVVVFAICDKHKKLLKVVLKFLAFIHDNPSI